MMKKFVLATMVLFQIDAYSQTETSFPDIAKHESGKCYAKSIVNEESAEWKQVVCDTDLDEYLINKIQSQLLKRKYLSRPFEPFLDEKTRTALAKYQRDNNLSTGEYIFSETLDALDVFVLTQRQREGFFTFSTSYGNEKKEKRLREINFYLLFDPEYQAEIKIGANSYQEFKNTKQSLSNQLIGLGWNKSDFVIQRK